MSGHSKWSTIKHQKQATDKARGQIFTKLANQITAAVRQSGGVTDPEVNFRLRLAIEKARLANMPKVNVERAIGRASAKGETAEIEEVLYEGFGPQGVAILVEGITDNKQRTAAIVKNTFLSHGGSLGVSGSVSYLFEKVGEIHLAKEMSPDNLLEAALEAGADDLEDSGERFIVYTKPQLIHQVKIILEQKNLHLLDSELTYRAKELVKVADPATAQKILALLTALDELDDVQKVYTNADLVLVRS